MTSNAFFVFAGLMLFLREQSLLKESKSTFHKVFSIILVLISLLATYHFPSGLYGTHEYFQDLEERTSQL